MTTLDDRGRAAAAAVHQAFEQLPPPHFRRPSRRPVTIVGTLLLLGAGSAGIAAFFSNGEDTLQLSTNEEVSVPELPLAPERVTATTTTPSTPTTTRPLPSTTAVVSPGPDIMGEDHAKRYVGARHVGRRIGEELLPGVRLVGWAQITSGESSDYSIVTAAEGDQQMLWFERTVATVENRTVNEVLDAIDIPPNSDTQFVFYGECHVNGARDPEMAVIIEWEIPATEWNSNILRAWRFSRSSETIEVVSTKGISCYNDGIGG